MSRLARREALTGWIFALPWVLGFLVFTAAPMLFSLYASFTRYPITSPPRWTGLENYASLFQDEQFYQALGNTLWMVGVKTPLVVAVALGLAVLLNQRLPLGKLFQTAVYLPTILGGAAAIFLWRWIMAPEGLLNRGLALLGIAGPAWFVDPAWTKPGMVVMGLWWIGGPVLIFLAGLRGIPEHLYEAAELEGASLWQKTRHVTLPLLSPTIFFVMVTTVIGTFQIFTSAYLLIDGEAATGGPGGSLLFYVLYLYGRAFGQVGAGGFQMGYASALAWVLFAIILLITLVQWRLSKRWVHYES